MRKTSRMNDYNEGIVNEWVNKWWVKSGWVNSMCHNGWKDLGIEARSTDISQGWFPVLPFHCDKRLFL